MKTLQISKEIILLTQIAGSVCKNVGCPFIVHSLLAHSQINFSLFIIEGQVYQFSDSMM